ncbi:putative U3 small nucleolar RNA-associated protein 11 [Smittium culicis]|uniref:U3 small nucleolar RNA-associated protein 11 n=1 Tax=Smittium culicis TaxID=133412 RepID=A0A1R1Y2F4_9FUNG|nr:putative U3 small nucleolar RNA-associated protein 11 [Smittium culicis]OMJ20916.1 putative U3 small nucleolar RNA-associated protein 11 [Smittium culicis]
MSSAFDKANPRRDHKERSQLVSRKKYGLLEKHKDYVLRARNYHAKKEHLDHLKEKARTKNQDEFYFAMEKNQTNDKGVHVTSRNSVLDAEVVQLLKSQDANYIQTQITINKNKIDRLKQSLAVDTRLDSGVNLNAEPVKKKLKLRTRSGKPIIDLNPTPKHMVFVDNSTKFATFDPSEHFDTPAPLLARKYNRVKNEKIDEVAENLPSAEVLHKMNTNRGQLAKELANRSQRQLLLERALRELCLQKELSKKGTSKKIGKDALGLPVYKWKYQRNK